MSILDERLAAYQDCRVVPSDDPAQGRWMVVHPERGTLSYWADHDQASGWIGEACNQDAAPELPDWDVPEGDDELWWEWYRLGRECACAIPGPGLTRLQVRIANDAYDAGFAEGFAEALEECERLFGERDPDPWDEVRDLRTGHGYGPDFDRTPWASEGH